MSFVTSRPSVSIGLSHSIWVGLASCRLITRSGAGFGCMEHSSHRHPRGFESSAQYGTIALHCQGLYHQGDENTRRCQGDRAQGTGYSSTSHYRSSVPCVLYPLSYTFMTHLIGKQL